jgi:hypothetical protein
MPQRTSNTYQEETGAGLAVETDDDRYDSPPPIDRFDSQELDFDRVLKVSRSGALLIIVFQVAYLLWDRSIWIVLPTGIMAFHGLNIAVGCSAFALSFSKRTWLERHWRALAFCSCAAVIAGTTGISVLTGTSETLFVVGILRDSQRLDDSMGTEMAGGI